MPGPVIGFSRLLVSMVDLEWFCSNSSFIRVPVHSQTQDYVLLTANASMKQSRKANSNFSP